MRRNFGTKLLWFGEDRTFVAFGCLFHRSRSSLLLGRISSIAILGECFCLLTIVSTSKSEWIDIYIPLPFVPTTTHIPPLGIVKETLSRAILSECGYLKVTFLSRKTSVSLAFCIIRIPTGIQSSNLVYTYRKGPQCRRPFCSVCWLLRKVSRHFPESA